MVSLHLLLHQVCKVGLGLGIGLRNQLFQVRVADSRVEDKEVELRRVKLVHVLKLNLHPAEPFAVEFVRGRQELSVGRHDLEDRRVITIDYAVHSLISDVLSDAAGEGRVQRLESHLRAFVLLQEAVHKIVDVGERVAETFLQVARLERLLGLFCLLGLFDGLLAVEESAFLVNV